MRILKIVENICSIGKTKKNKKAKTLKPLYKLNFMFNEKLFNYKYFFLYKNWYYQRWDWIPRQSGEFNVLSSQYLADSWGKQTYSAPGGNLWPKSKPDGTVEN